MSAEYNDVLHHRKFIGNGLSELFPVGRSENNLIIFTLRLQKRDDPVDRFNLHHHPRFPSKGIIIYPFVLIECIITKVMKAKINQSLILGPLQNAVVKGPFYHFR
ncbi:hypothetical protein SDC9_210320 [bioreactor metagenome]|uniref:Uncharacterized protein n=1 Tax=bioreactor metagenome TaxID=1076179 RepID=A0A645JG34_9ZZZZ